jgi:hypothetical protein
LTVKCNLFIPTCSLFQAKKIEEHLRRKQRKRDEKDLHEKKERIRKAKDAREAAAKAAAAGGGNPMVLF